MEGSKFKYSKGIIEFSMDVVMQIMYWINLLWKTSRFGMGMCRGSWVIVS